MLFVFFTLLQCLFFFFFSSRRRHTRFDCDWSSDVCSSDLPAPSSTRRIMKSVGSQSHTDSDFSAVRRATAYAISPYKPKQASSKASPPEKPETVARRRSRRKESSVWERTVLTRSRPANRQEGHEIGRAHV